MLFDPTDWQNTFYKDKTTRWKCPTCTDGYLACDNNLIESFETSKSKEIQELYGFPPEEMKIRFSGFLTCNNTECKDKIAVIGKKQIVPKTEFDIDGVPYQEYDAMFIPEYFQPEIMFFQIPENCPEKITLQIKKAFSSYWNDISTSANKIRKALELIMDDKEIKGDKLHGRIKDFEKIEPEIGKALLALKWIGNIGSHTGTIEKDDILKTFQVLNFALIKLYDEKERLINGYVEEINRNKGLTN